MSTFWLRIADPVTESLLLLAAAGGTLIGLTASQCQEKLFPKGFRPVYHEANAPRDGIFAMQISQFFTMVDRAEKHQKMAPGDTVIITSDFKTYYLVEIGIRL